MRRKLLITCALPYANGALHFGHIAGVYLPGDCYARFQRQQGADVLFLSGSDEHGVAVTLSAELAGRTPAEQVERYHRAHQATFRQLNIVFDHYTRTTWKGHRQTTEEVFNDLVNNGYIEQRRTEQLYCPRHQRFYADRYVVGICPRCRFAEARGDECPRCGASYEATDLAAPRARLGGEPLVRQATTHCFLRFDLLRSQLQQWMANKKWKRNVAAFIQRYLEELRPRAISRDGQWGIPVPGMAGKVFYVWFDAPLAYISAAKEWAAQQQQPEKWRDYWLDPQTELVQFIGKDNIPFHALFFPAMLMGQNVAYKRVDALPASEFYRLEGKPFSKSEEHLIDLEEFFAHFSTDQARYALAASAPETGDSDFRWPDFQRYCNKHLVATFGNFAQRVLAFIHAYCQGRVPTQGELSDREQLFGRQVERLVEEISTAYGCFQLRRVSQLLMELARSGNVYFDHCQPWRRKGDEAARGELESMLHCCLEALKRLAVTAGPLLPQTAARLWAMLGLSGPLAEWRWDRALAADLVSGRALPPPRPLFQPVSSEQIARVQRAMEERSCNGRSAGGKPS